MIIKFNDIDLFVSATGAQINPEIFVFDVVAVLTAYNPPLQCAVATTPKMLFGTSVPREQLKL